ncbi:uncharacterized protein LOC106175104 isoform X1 [Lingula anatina]|uniref:Uncharacterized protein LOC106175104 isoform X1 n=1 Tax=Lingula anatina TaxID=7574 RepID=A0A1S3JPU7_LINAN|nr:uncharacterized protein LOC106175104 isoform X1 [Lingula anatina]|eukprot:XP_013412388.1 uncharacterized protein LOC106175104 isoform X1 [Lingula anatina]
MKLIPGLTKYRISEARKHAAEVGKGQPVQKQESKRSRLDMVKVDHFLDFISRPEFLQDVAYGSRMLKLSSGETIEVPNAVRTLIASRLVQLYQLYCEENDFVPLGRSTLLNILQVCEASQRKSVAGLDNIAAEGSTAFETLENIVLQLGEQGFSGAWVKEQHSRLRDSKNYLKSDYKLHIKKEDQCADHCISYALSLPPQCNHDHNMACGSCDGLSSILNDIEVVIMEEKTTFRYPEQKEEMLFDFSKSRDSIFLWKNHIVRSKNQDQGKVDVLENLTSTQALVTMDWAMKFLPTKFREAQQDWFAKKGISWHVTAAVTIGDGEIMIYIALLTCWTTVHKIGLLSFQFWNHPSVNYRREFQLSKKCS